jgi:hypothetical protein
VFFFKAFVFGQNLLKNPSFEEVTTCEWQWFGGLVVSTDWHNAAINSSVDLYHPCDSSGFLVPPSTLTGYQVPHQGDAFIGMGWSLNGLNFREYAQTKLKVQLSSGQHYCFNLFFVASGYSKYGTDGLGVVFSDTAIFCGTDSCVFNTVPQFQSNPGVPQTDSVNWKNISGILTANGTENYLTIGCFYPDTLLITGILNPTSIYVITADYFIDDLSLSLCRPPVLGSDTMLVYGSSIVLGDTAQDVARYQWFPSDGLLCDTCWQTLAHPLQDTEYILQKITACDTTYDSVRVRVLEPGFVDYHFSLSPNPSAGPINLNYSSDMEIEMMVYNSLGQELKKIILPASSIGTYTFYLVDLSNGVYFFIFSNENKKLDSQRIVIYR